VHFVSITVQSRTSVDAAIDGRSQTETIMLETYFSAPKMLGHLRRAIPCGPYLDGFAAALERQGYGPETAVRYLRAAAHVGHVMAWKRFCHRICGAALSSRPIS
jgi:hypothetical protein